MTIITIAMVVINRRRIVREDKANKEQNNQ